jgi:adenylate kinase
MRTREAFVSSNRSAYFAGVLPLALPLVLASLAVVCHGQQPAPFIILVGPPGAGKTTQAEILHKELGMAVISADDLIRRNPQQFEKFKNPEIQGVEPRLDPALNRLMDQALASTDRSKGVILDGYPAAKIQGDYLSTLQSKYGLKKPLVIHLRVPDEVVKKRLAVQTRPDLQQELKDYHRELDFVRDYFPQTDIRDIDGTKSISQVAKEIRRQVG